MSDLRVRRSNRWFVVLFILMIVGGICAVGYWQTYDIKCGLAKPTFTFNKFPPQFVCPGF